MLPADAVAEGADVAALEDAAATTVLEDTTATPLLEAFTTMLDEAMRVMRVVTESADVEASGATDTTAEDDCWVDEPVLELADPARHCEYQSFCTTHI